MPTSATSPAVNASTIRQFLESSLEALARTLQAVRDGSPAIKPGEPVTVSILPAPSELSISNLANLTLSLTGELTGGIAGTLGDLAADLSAALDPKPITGSLVGTAQTLTANLEPGNIVGPITGTVSGVAASLNADLDPGPIVGSITGEPETLTANLDPGTIAGAITGSLGDLAANLTSNLTSAPASGLAALVPIPFSLPVSLSVTWSLFKQAEVIQPPVNFPRPKKVPLNADSFVAPDGLSSPTASFIFLPQDVRELTAAPVPATACFIRATVKLVVNPSLVPVLADVIGTEPITVSGVDLPDVPILLSPLQTPRVLALFRHDTFEPFQFESSPKDDDGFVLILVPESSPLRSAAQLEAVLGELDSTVSRLSALLPASSILVPSEAGTLRNLASLLVGIRQLAGALSQPHVRFRVRNSVDDLVAIHMIKRSFAGIDPVERDVRAGDEISSLIFIGLPGDKVRCWNNKNFHNEDRQRKGQLLITIGPEMIVAITNLNSASPPTEPVGRAQVVISANKPDAFGDAFESLKFEFPPEQE